LKSLTPSSFARRDQPRDLPIEGRNLKGVHLPWNSPGHTQALLDGHKTATTFLPLARRHGHRRRRHRHGLCRTAMRHGCTSLVQLEFCPAALDRAKDNPGPNGRRLPLDYGQEEAAASSAATAVYLRLRKICQRRHGHVKKVHTVQIQWERNDKGQFAPRRFPARNSAPRSIGAVGDGLSRPGTTALEHSAWSATCAQREGGVRKIFHEIKACSPPVMSPRPSSLSGLSTKVAAPRASATVT